MKNWQTEMLRNVRLSKKMTQQTVANMANMYVREYQRLEMGERTMENVSMEHGLAVCDVLGIDPYEIVFGGPFRQGDPSVKLQDRVGIFKKATLDNMDREWERFVYMPTNEPFDVASTKLNESTLAEEVSRITGIDVELAFIVLSCEMSLLEQTQIREAWTREVAKGVSYLTKVDYDIVLQTLEAEYFLLEERNVVKMRGVTEDEGAAAQGSKDHP